MPPLARRSPQENAQRQPVSVVSAVSRHLGLSRSHLVVRAGPGVIGLGPSSGGWPVLVGHTVARNYTVRTTAPARHLPSRRRPPIRAGSPASRSRLESRIPSPSWDTQRTGASPFAAAPTMDRESASGQTAVAWSSFWPAPQRKARACGAELLHRSERNKRDRAARGTRSFFSFNGMPSSSFFFPFTGVGSRAFERQGSPLKGSHALDRCSPGIGPSPRRGPPLA